LNVRNLDRHSPFDCITDRGLADADVAISELGNNRIVESVGRSQPKFLVRIVEPRDDPAESARALECRYSSMG
jgi:hypothetical protein